MSRPEEVEAPNGVRAVEHRLEGESRVRAEAGASHDVDDATTPVEVQVGAGALWVSVPDGGVEVQVNHGGSGALVTGGALMVDAGEGSDALLLVTAGEVLLVDAAGTTQVLTAGDAAVLGADGNLAGIDQVGEDELEADPWATANRALDEDVVLPEPEADEQEAEAEEPEDEAEEPEPEPVVEEPIAEEPEAAPEVEADREVEPEAVAEEPEPEPEPDEPPAADEAGRVAEPEDAAPAGGEVLEELYAPDEAEAHEVSGRSFARVLQVAALIIFIAVGALLVFLFKHNDSDKGDTTLVAPTTVHNTTSSTTTKPRSTTSTTQVVVPIKVGVLTCTQKGEALVASGSVEGAPKTADGYRITVVVKLGNRTFGKRTVTVPRGDNATGKRTWTAEIPLNGDAVGAHAQCKVPRDGITLVT